MSPLVSSGFRPFRGDPCNYSPSPVSYPTAAPPSLPPPGDSDAVMGESEDEDFGKDVSPLSPPSPGKGSVDAVREDVS